MPLDQDPIIAFCWLVFFTVWIVAAFFTKRTTERARWRSAWWLWVGIGAFVVFRRRFIPLPGSMVLWHPTHVIRILAESVTAVGLFIALWARTVLGANWSANVVLKEQHELIVQGPYRVVRHPIYTGVILMIIGTILVWGRVAGLILLVLSVAGLLVKAHREEQLLTTHFPDAYPRYRQRVKAAIIPFLV